MRFLPFLVAFFAFANCDANADADLKIDALYTPDGCDVKTKNGDMLTMHYTGTLTDGTKFDSSCAEAKRERTFVMVKPDGVQRGLVGEVVGRFERKGLKLSGMKLVRPDRQLLAEHYAEHAGKSFFEGLVEYVGSGPVVAMVWEGDAAVRIGRMLIGKTNPAESAPGTIRGDFCVQMGRNLVHGSDGVDSAKREIDLWFGRDELVDWRSDAAKWIYEK